jgi:signal transduction histidine kinase
MAETIPSHLSGILGTMRTMLDQVDHPLCIVDLRGRVAYANPGFSADCGRHQESLVDESLAAIHPGLATELTTLISDQRLGRGSGCRAPSDAGSPSLVPLEDAGGNLVAIACLLPPAERAAAGRSQADQHAEGIPVPLDPATLQARFRRLTEDMQSFIYIASHDLQEPLRTISNSISIIQRNAKDNLDARTQEFLNYTVDAARRMQRLIDELLIFSRIGTNDQPFQPVDLEESLATAMESLAPSLDETGARLTHADLPTIPAKPGMMPLLLQHLIDNAMKFRSAAPPRIHLDCRNASDGWKLALSDNGIGILPEFQDRIFGIFKRLHTRSRYPGMGAGLAICRRIVERHGGIIWVESPDAGGSTFHFTLSHNPPVDQ